MNIRHRLWLLIALAWAVLSAIAGYSLYIQKDGLMHARRVKTYNTLELAYGVVDYYQRQAAGGVLSRAAAQEAAKATIAGLRYDGDNYFSLYDLNYRMVGHPIMPELNGRNLSELQDADGVKIVVDLVEAAKRGRGEFVHYLWPKPGSHRPVPKMATSRLFEPWGWVLQTGIYIDDVEAEFQRQILIYGSAISFAIAALLLVSWRIARSISQPLRKLQTTVCQFAAGVAEPQAEPRRKGPKNEIDQLADAFRDMTVRLAAAHAELSAVNAEREAINEHLLAELTERQRLVARLEEAQNQLLQSDKMASIGQLAAGVAHEINNPIGFVNSNLGTLNRYVRDLLRLIEAYGSAAAPLPAVEHLKQEVEFDFLKDDIRALIQESQDGLERVKKIVQDLKDFSRVDTSQQWQWTDLHECLDSTLNVAHNELKHKADVVKAYGDLPEVECLPSQLNQVFLNLMVNAAHAIPNRGTITLSSGSAGDWAWVAVTDTGSGISPEHMKRIFEPFFTTKPVGQGTGLGLSVSYNIVAKHGGRIEVESELGKGTTFRVWLPVAHAAAEAAPA